MYEAQQKLLARQDEINKVQVSLNGKLDSIIGETSVNVQTMKDFIVSQNVTLLQQKRDFSGYLRDRKRLDRFQIIENRVSVIFGVVCSMMITIVMFLIIYFTSNSFWASLTTSFSIGGVSLHIFKDMARMCHKRLYNGYQKCRGKSEKRILYDDQDIFDVEKGHEGDAKATPISSSRRNAVPSIPVDKIPDITSAALRSKSCFPAKPKDGISDTSSAILDSMNSLPSFEKKEMKLVKISSKN